jgi:arginyl-tRNA synthetase
MKNYKEEIKKVLEKITGVENPQVEFASDEKFGDYSSNICLKDKTLDIDNVIQKVNELSKDFTVEKIGRFINFRIKNDVLIYGLIQEDTVIENNNKAIVIDYSAPNIAKPFGIGHLRSTVIGQAIYNLYKYLGYNVIGDNHLGDWGTQFGKLLYMIDKTKTTDLSIENLEKMYVEFHEMANSDPSLEEKAREWFKKLEDNDTTARTIWKQCINVSLNEFNKIYNLLGVKIDNAYGESFYEEEMKEMLNDAEIKKFIEDGEDGKSKIINLEKLGIKTPLMVLKSDGATTYATRDLATIRFRQKKYNPDIIIYEVGAEQSLHFQQVFAASKLLKIIDNDVELVHTAHGLYLATDGKKFSTRKGKTIKLEEVLLEAIDRAKKLGSEDDETAKQVGIGAIKYFDLMHSVQSNVIFDWEKIMNMEGNSGPYLQYAVARINSVVSKADNKNKVDLKKIELNNEETLLLHKLSQFYETIESAAKSYSPNILCNYLYELASKFNTFYNAHKIIGGENEEFKLLLSKQTGNTLKTGLKLLGIECPEKM